MISNSGEWIKKQTVLPTICVLAHQEPRVSFFQCTLHQHRPTTTTVFHSCPTWRYLISSFFPLPLSQAAAVVIGEYKTMNEKKKNKKSWKALLYVINPSTTVVHSLGVSTAFSTCSHLALISSSSLLMLYAAWANIRPAIVAV